jgi:hypothetical protein
MAFFYFGFINKDTPPDAVLRSLIEQFSVQCASMPHALESLFSKNEQGGAAPTAGPRGSDVDLEGNRQKLPDRIYRV